MSQIYESVVKEKWLWRFEKMEDLSGFRKEKSASNSLKMIANKTKQLMLFQMNAY